MMGLNVLRTIIFTGVSGGGKTTALRAVEDLGFYCVDNLPLPLFNDFVETMKMEPTVDRVGLVVDARLRGYAAGYAVASAALKSSGYLIEIVYLDADNDVLIRRFSQTRRRHPLGKDDLMAGLEEERRLLEPLRALATVCVDTSDMTVHQLKHLIQDRYCTDDTRLVVSLLSFGFRHGLPSYADLVFDVRFLPNPFFVDDLQNLNGKDKRVSDFVLESKDAKEFLAHTEKMLRFLVPKYESEGKVYLTVGIGCTGGYHRSVALAAELARRLENDFSVTVRHRDIDR